MPLWTLQPRLMMLMMMSLLNVSSGEAALGIACCKACSCISVLLLFMCLCVWGKHLQENVSSVYLVWHILKYWSGHYWRFDPSVFLLLDIQNICCVCMCVRESDRWSSLSSWTLIRVVMIPIFSVVDNSACQISGFLIGFRYHRNN